MSNLALGAQRRDVPWGHVPSYDNFLKTIWRWRDEEGRGCLDAPPWMYTVLVEDDTEKVLVDSLTRAIGLGKVEVRTLDDGTEFSFADLKTLHMFLNLLVAIGAKDNTAKRVAEYILWTLGFRWV